MTNTQKNNIRRKDTVIFLLGLGFFLYLLYPLVAFTGKFYIDCVTKGLSLYRNVTFEGFIEGIKNKPEATILLFFFLYGFHRITCFDKEKRKLISKSLKIDMKYFLLKIVLLFAYFHLYAVVPLKLLYPCTEYWFRWWCFSVVWITLPLFLYISRKV